MPDPHHPRHSRRGRFGEIGCVARGTRRKRELCSMSSTLSFVGTGGSVLAWPGALPCVPEEVKSLVQLPPLLAGMLQSGFRAHSRPRPPPPPCPSPTPPVLAWAIRYRARPFWVDGAGHNNLEVWVWQFPAGFSARPRRPPCPRRPPRPALPTHSDAQNLLRSSGTFLQCIRSFIDEYACSPHQATRAHRSN